MKLITSTKTLTEIISETKPKALILPYPLIPSISRRFPANREHCKNITTIPNLVEENDVILFKHQDLTFLNIVITDRFNPTTALVFRLKELAEKFNLYSMIVSILPASKNHNEAFRRHLLQKLNIKCLILKL